MEDDYLPGTLSIESPGTRSRLVPWIFFGAVGQEMLLKADLDPKKTTEVNLGSTAASRTASRTMFLACS